MAMPTSLKLAWRSLLRSPVFSTSVVVTLILGIGANTTVFTVLNAVLFKPLPYREPARLAGAWMSLPGMHSPRAPQTLATYLAYKRFARSIDGIAAFQPMSVNAVLRPDAVPERLRASGVTANTFSLLGISLELGRGFTEAEDTPRGEPVALIGDGLWRRRFGADPGVVGRRIQIDGRGTTIVGVLPPDCHFPDATIEIWTPLALDPSSPLSGPFSLQSFVRLRPGVDIATAQHEFNDLLPRAAELVPVMAPGATTASILAQSGARAFLRPMRVDVIGTSATTLWVAAAAGMLVLVISCANVASLLITRLETRQRDLAIRAALGADGLRALSQVLSETALLCCLGGIGGLMCAYIGTRALVSVAPPGIPRIAEVRLDGVVGSYTIAITMIVALSCVVVAAVRSRSTRLAHVLRTGGRGDTTERRRVRARWLLVACQLAMAVVLVASATLLARSLNGLRRVHLGFDADHTLSAWLSLPQAEYPTDSAVVRFTRDVSDGLQHIPGVRAAGVTSKVPLNRLGALYTPIWTDAATTPGPTLPPSEQLTTVTGGYFDAMGIPLIAGRTFEALDRQPAYEAIIDVSLARQYWDDSTGGRALGRHVRFAPTGGPAYTVVGVVGSVRDTSVAAPPTGIVYLPDVVAPDPNQSAVIRTLGIVVRTTGEPRAPMRDMDRVVREVDRSIPVFAAAPMDDTVAKSMAHLSFVIFVLVVSAVVALVLAAVGVYGVTAYIVGLRAKEISVRIALGAVPSSVVALMTRQAAAIATAGIVIGIAIFVFLSRLLASMVYGVTPADPVTLLGVSGFMWVVGVCASWLPARAASHADPVDALGAE
jgi:putative ABC transport system permease protein